MSLPDLPGLLSATDLARTVDTIVDQQQPSGMIPWFPGGHADPWNHVEAAMALLIGGRRNAADRAYDWLLANQRADGAWHHYYVADRVEQDKLEANVSAYVATGVWHHWLLTGDRGALETMWRSVERAIDFVLDLQTPRGEIIWARHPDGTPWSFALLTGSSSICHSLRCAIAIAEELGEERPDWELSLARLARVIRMRPDGAFAPKNRWAMDWYYPVLCGAITGAAARAHLGARHDSFVMPGIGVRCVSDRPWVTAAETCECALAYLGIGDDGTARELFGWAQAMRVDDGRYWTGIVHPEGVHFPADETSTYTAAAVVLTADALSGATKGAGLFTRHDTLPPMLDLDDELEVELDRSPDH
jgi:hypothetical protein